MAESLNRKLPANQQALVPSTLNDEFCTFISNQQAYLFNDSLHSSHLLDGLNVLRESKSFCDITLSVGGSLFHCHKIVLIAFSPYFKAMFLSSLQESFQDVVNITGVDGNIMQLLLDYAYSSRVQITKFNVQALLSAANLLEILPVRDACCDFMEQSMDDSNCIGIHCFAEAHACLDLQKKSKEYILHNFVSVCMLDEFVTLEQAKLIEIISDDNLEVNFEEVVFTAAIRWLNYDEDNRLVSFYIVLSHIRLPFLSPYFLCDAASTYKNVMEMSECQKLIDEAKNFHLLPDRRNEFFCNRIRPRPSIGSFIMFLQFH